MDHAYLQCSMFRSLSFADGQLPYFNYSRMVLHHLGLLPSFPNLLNSRGHDAVASADGTWCSSSHWRIWFGHGQLIHLSGWSSGRLEAVWRYRFSPWNRVWLRYMVFIGKLILLWKVAPIRQGCQNVCFIHFYPHQCYDLMTSALLNQPKRSLARRHFEA